MVGGLPVLKDRFGRTINYLRISVTDRCNLQCRYCRPPHAPLLPAVELLTDDEICTFARTAAESGITKFRITGGEPLLRPGIISLVEKIAGMERITDLGLTTNGILLAEYARPLAAAGLQRVNVSLDSLIPHRYTTITGGGHLRDAIAGIDAALAAGLIPVKLNCVVDTEEDAHLLEADHTSLVEFAAERGLELRVIRRMDLDAGKFSVVEGGCGGDCPRCNRIRLVCDGTVRPCLFSDLAFSIRTFGPQAALMQAIEAKPQSGGRCTHNWIYGIGG